MLPDDIGTASKDYNPQKIEICQGQISPTPKIRK